MKKLCLFVGTVVVGNFIGRVLSDVSKELIPKLRHELIKLENKKHSGKEPNGFQID